VKLWPFSRPGGPIEKQIEAAPSQKASTVFSPSDLFLTGQELVYGTGGIEKAYSNSWIAYSCIRRLAQDAAGVPLLFLSDPKDPESEVPDNHPTRQLFMHPSPYFSTGELIQWIVTMLNMRGEFFIPFDDSMRPTQMFPETDPLHWREIVTGMELLGWKYQYAGNTMHRTPDELIHHRFVNPTNVFRGQAPLQAASKAFAIEQGADKLTLNIVSRGGEKAALFTSENEVTRQQRDQAIAMLRGRRAGDATVGKDVLLPNGVKPLDPKFIEDDETILEAAKAQPDKIAAVYGVPKSLLGFEDVDKFATFMGRKRMFYDDTLVPMLKGVTGSFDRFFIETLTSQYHCYVRFDWAQVTAMQDNVTERFDMAGKAKAAGLPWAVLNDRFELGLDVSGIPGADTIMVPSNQAPLDKLIEEWNTASTPAPPIPPAGVSEPGKIDGDDGPRLSNALIRKRARDTRSTIQRGFRILKEEKEFRKEWKTLLHKHMNKAVKLAGRIETASDVEKVLAPAFEGLGESMGKVASPHHQAGALEGERSIVELVEGKMADATLGIWQKAHQWSPGVAKFLKNRTNLVVGMEQPIFDDVIAAVTETVVGGAEVSEVQHVIRTRFASAPGGINRATTIARTEIGTAYNVARFAEMKDQDFEKHEWLTNGDELVRETHVEAGNAGAIKIGDNFPGVGIPYPQSEEGEASEVINCRCETIPVLKG